MRLKRSGYFLLAACLAFTALSIEALRAHEGREEEPDPPGLLSEKYTDMLDAHLRLSEKQREKIYSIVKEARPALRKKLEQLKGLREQMRSLGGEMRAQMRDASERIRSELNNEQKDRFDELKVQMRQPMRPGFQPRMGPGGAEDMMGPPEMWRGPDGGPSGKGGGRREKEGRGDDD